MCTFVGGSPLLDRCSALTVCNAALMQSDPSITLENASLGYFGIQVRLRWPMNTICWDCSIWQLPSCMWLAAYKEAKGVQPWPDFI